MQFFSIILKYFILQENMHKNWSHFQWSLGGSIYTIIAYMHIPMVHFNTWLPVTRDTFDVTWTWHYGPSLHLMKCYVTTSIVPHSKKDYLISMLFSVLLKFLVFFRADIEHRHCPSLSSEKHVSKFSYKKRKNNKENRTQWEDWNQDCFTDTWLQEDTHTRKSQAVM